MNRTNPPAFINKITFIILFFIFLSISSSAQCTERHDVNKDGLVSFWDLVYVSRHYHDTYALYPLADVTDDGLIDESDIQEIIGCYGVSIREAEFFSDLIVSSLNWTPLNPKTGDTVKITVRVENIGDWTTSSDIYADFRVVGTYNESCGSASTTQRLGPGEGINMSFNWDAGRNLGSNLITVYADSNNTCWDHNFNAESNETNNIIIGSMYVAGPDLIITDVSTDPNPIVPGLNHVNVTVSNVGGGSTISPISVKFGVLGEDCNESEYQGVLASAESHVFQFPDYEITGAGGGERLNVSVDVNPDVCGVNSNRNLEENESNNYYLDGYVAVNGIDIVVGSVTITPSNPITGELVQINATILNIGSTTASSTIYTDFNITGDWGSSCASVFSPSPLNSGESYVFSYEWNSWENMGLNDLTIIVDKNTTCGFHDNHAEANEGNNEWLGVINVAGPDLIITNVSTHPDPPSPGKNNMNVTVENVGLGEAVNNVFVSYTSNGVDCNVSESIGPILPGQSYTFEILDWDIDFTDIGNTVNVSVDADPDLCGEDYNQNPEENESNNYYVNGVIGTSGVDLIVESVNWTPISPSTGDMIFINATVMNIGLEATYNTTFADFNITGEWGSYCGTVNTSAIIAPNDNFSFNFPWNSTYNMGDNTLTVSVDENSSCGQHDYNLESNELNNDWVGVIDVAGPDVVLTNVATYPNPPAPGLNDIFITIENIGVGRAVAPIPVRYGAFGAECNETVHPGGLNPGESQIIEVYDFYLSEGAVGRVLNVSVDADPDICGGDSNSNPEENESNNYFSDGIIGASGFADLIVESVSVNDSNPYPGDVLLINGTVKNTGGEPAGYSIFVDFKLDDGSCIGYQYVTFDLLSGESQYFEYNWIVNRSGLRTITAVVDSVTCHNHDYNLESNETNNEKVAGVIDVPGPDLIVSSVSTNPYPPIPGGNYLNITIKNVGQVATGNTNIYISYKAEGSGCNYNNVNEDLSVGEEYTFLDKYYSISSSSVGETLMVDVDSNPDLCGYNHEYVAETNDSNNYSVGIVGGPDMIVSSASVNSTFLNAGDTVILNVTIQNIGPIETGLKTHYVDFVLDDGTCLGYRNVYRNFLPGESYNFPTLNWVSNRAGLRTVYAVTDSLNSDNLCANHNSNYELSEENNTLVAGVINISGSDLFIQDLVLSSYSIATGDTLQINTTVENIGPVSTGLRTMYVDYTLDDGYCIGYSNVNVDLAPGKNYNFSKTWSVNKLGVHTLTAIADTKNTCYTHDNVPEINELNNNETSASFNIDGPDLILIDVQANPTDAGTGENVVLSGKVKNIGVGKALSSVYVDFYTDSGLCLPTKYIGSNLLAGQEYPFTHSWATSDLGSHEINATVDSNNSDNSCASHDYNLESNETNNNASIGIVNINPPDLIIEDIVWSPLTPKTGDTLKINATVKNIGTGTAGYTIYADFKLNSTCQGSISSATDISPGKNLNLTYTYSNVNKVGTYTLYGITDNDIPSCDYYHDYNPESVEMNNNLTGGIITFIGPDLVIEDLEVDKTSLTLGDTLRINGTVRNIGQGKAMGQIYITIMLNDSSTCILNQYLGYQLNSGAAYTFTKDWIATTAGSFQVIARTDTDNSGNPCNSYDYHVEESEANNEMFVGPIIITGSGPDLIISNVTSSPDPPVAGTNYLNITVSNIGLQATGLKTMYASMLAQGSSCYTQNFYTNLDPGDNYTLLNNYYPISASSAGQTLMFDVDSGPNLCGYYYNYVSEVDESNNEYSDGVVAAPDMIVSYAGMNTTSASLGDKVQLNATIRNIGLAQTGSKTMYVDFHADDGECLGTSSAYFNILPGDSYVFAPYVWSVDKAGTFDIIAVTDSLNSDNQCPNHNSNTEQDESNNNLSVGPMNVAGPDLVIENLVLSLNSLDTGDTLQINSTVRNIGPGGTGLGYIYVDHILSDGTCIGNKYLYVNIGPGETQYFPFNWDVNKIGSFVVTASVDNEHPLCDYYHDNFPESDELNNNLTSGLFAVAGSDLILLDLQVNPSDAGTGETIVLSGKVENIGSGKTLGSVYVSFISDQGLCITNHYVGANLLGGQQLSFSYPWVTSDLGVHNINATVDSVNSDNPCASHDYNVEEDESNNNGTLGTVTINLPDLIVSDITINPLNAGTGQTIQINATVKNVGSGTAGYSIYAAYILEDGTCLTYKSTSDDLPYGQEKVFTYDWITNDIGSPTVTVVTDNDIPSCGWYFDYNPESNEFNNNLTSERFNIIPPDLIIEEVSWGGPSNPKVGDTMQLNVTVKNIGQGTAGYTIYADLVLDDGFCIASQNTLTNILPGESYTFPPYDWVVSRAGSRTLIAVTDSDIASCSWYHDTNPESNELNNNKNANTIFIDGADLVVTNVQTHPDPPSSGMTNNFNVTIKNIGGVRASNYLYMAYNIPNTVCYQIYYGGGLNPGQEYNYTFSRYIQPASSGETIAVDIDRGPNLCNYTSNYHSEVDESNNIYADGIIT